MSDVEEHYCPECQLTLTPRTVRNMRLLACTNGHGTWISQDQWTHFSPHATDPATLEQLQLWNEPKRLLIMPSPLISPAGFHPMLEVTDSQTQNITIYADLRDQALWVHPGEEEKIQALWPDHPDPDQARDRLFLLLKNRILPLLPQLQSMLA